MPRCSEDAPAQGLSSHWLSVNFLGPVTQDQSCQEAASSDSVSAAGVGRTLRRRWSWVILYMQEDHFGGGAICRNSSILCLLLSYIWHGKFHLQRWFMKPLQHCNINFDLHLEDKVYPLHNFLHWPILPNFLEICYGPQMLRCEHRRRKNQRPWFHFTPKCNLLKGLRRVILQERKIRTLLEFLFFFFNLIVSCYWCASPCLNVPCCLHSHCDSVEPSPNQAFF